MRTCAFAWLTCLLVATHVAGASKGNAQLSAEVADAPVLDDRYPTRIIDFGDVEGLPDLVYATVAGFRPLRLDLYRPKGAMRARPLVVYVHGGGWQGGHTRHSGAFSNWPRVLASLAAKGYVVVSIEYRLSAEAPFPAAFDDVKAALRWLRSQSAVYGIDGSRVVIWGGSAGGQLAALAATNCIGGVDPSGAKDAASACVQGAVAWYGIFDLAAVLAAEKAPTTGNDAPSVARRYLDCAAGNCNAAIVATASPISHIDAKDPPVLLIHGRLDRVAPVEQSLRFDEALRAGGVHTTLKIIEGVDHSFIGATPEKTHEASLAALRSTFDFIDATIGDRQ